jgi:hypothetical protein
VVIDRAECDGEVRGAPEDIGHQDEAVMMGDAIEDKWDIEYAEGEPRKPGDACRTVRRKDVINLRYRHYRPDDTRDDRDIIERPQIKAPARIRFSTRRTPFAPMYMVFDSLHR